jgi:hypothetical protein
MLLWLRNLNFRGSDVPVLVPGFGKLLAVPQGIVDLTVQSGTVQIEVPEGTVVVGTPE